MKKLVLSLFLFLYPFLIAEPLPKKPFFQKPKLVVYLVFDQLRADFLSRFSSLPNSQPMGIQYLLEKSAWFPSAQFIQLQNLTCPGHATLVTGAYPYRSGIVLNDWFDIEKNGLFYCAEDPAFSWLTGEKSKEAGTSPRSLIGSTLGDEFKNTFPNARVISLALKDRAAIMMGGHRADLALWLDPKAFQWTTTKYYVADGVLPPFVEKENKQLQKIKNEPLKKDLLPAVFPQGLRWQDASALGTPAGLELTERLMLSGIESLSLGSKGTDFLFVSFSSHDIVGHAYGPQSDTMTEMLKAEDKMLSRILAHLKSKFPNLQRDVLLVLTSDHGVAPNPEWSKMKNLGGGRIEDAEVAKKLDKALTDKFGKVDGGWILKTLKFHVYLNKKAAEKKGISFAEIQEFTREELLKIEGVFFAFTENDYWTRRLPAGLFEKQILNSYFPGRSGHVVGILKPFFNTGDETASHETGYSYDSTIPVVLMGAPFKPGIYSTHAEAADIAPTVAHVLGIVAPSNSNGRVLDEVLRTNGN